MQTRTYWVYIMTGASRALYIGMTGNLVQRVWQHKNKEVEGFTKRYNLTQLVYYESTHDVMAALEREKQLKGWMRARNRAIVSQFNPSWRDLADEVLGG